MLRYAWCLSVVLLLATVLGAVAAVGLRPRVDLLDGWEFRLDPDREGVDARWFARPLPDAGAIVVPGCWEAQGYGKATRDARHDADGWGWYARQVDIPEGWTGAAVFMHLGPVHRTAVVWVNGVEVHRQVGYVTAAEFEITPALRGDGQPDRITVLVDSDQDVAADPLAGCYDTYDFVKWGGIYGHTWVECRHGLYLDDLFVRSEKGSTAARVTAAVRRVPRSHEVSGAWQVRGTIEPLGDGESYSASVSIDPSSGGAGDIELVVPTPGARAWSPREPCLYRVSLRLIGPDGVVRDALQTRFGFREIEIRGNDLFLNGDPLFLRGYGDDACFPLTVCPPADPAFYRDRFAVARDYGFNFVRHHSHVPVQAYFDAADEMGMLIQPELPIAYERHILQAAGPGLEVFRRQWREIVVQYRNHPSLLIWCMGNELWDSHPLAEELYRVAKEMDPTRPVCDSDGLRRVPSTWARPTLDIAHVQFSEHTIPWGASRGKYELSAAPAKPVTIHEMGNFVAFPDIRDARRYTGLVKASWLVGEASVAPIGYASHRDIEGSMYFVRQRGAAWRLAWETAPVPPGDNSSVSFAWTGATGFRSEPAGRFTLDVGGRTSIAFDCPEKSPGTWASSDGLARLVFDVKNDGVDQFGVMVLTVNRELLTVGVPLRLTATGSASASDRWFGVYDWTDTVAYEQARGGFLPEVANPAPVSGFVRLLSWRNADGASVRSMAREAGTVEELPVFAENSRYLQALCRKLNMEAARRSSEIDGYTLWLLQDYWKGGQGLLDQFYEPKGLSAAECRQWNSASVVLLDRDRCVYRAGETIHATAVVSHFGSLPLRRARLGIALHRLARDGTLTEPALHASTRRLDALAPGTVTPVVDLALTAPGVSRPERYRLTLTVRDDQAAFTNHWQLLVLPDPTPGARTGGLGFVGGRRFTSFYPGAIQVPPLQPVPDTAKVWLTGALTEPMLEVLDRGGRVLLLSRDAVAGDALRFKSPWWFSRPTDSNLGTVVADHPALGDIPHDGWCDLPWFEVIEGAVAMHHTGDLARVAPIIRSIDMPLRQMHRSLLFETRVGGGSLLVCSLNLTSDTVRRSPMARHLLDQLITYALGSEFQPDSTVTVDQLRSCLAGTSSRRTTYVEGFSRICSVAADEHSGQTPTAPVLHPGCWGDEVETWIVRQNDGTRSVTWETAAVPELLGTDTVTVWWTGVLGWVSEPAAGFTLSIGGQPALRFDVPAGSATWSDDDGTVLLRFTVKQAHGMADRLGVFQLQVPADSVTPGAPLLLTVQGGRGSRRWFAVQAYRDTVVHALELP